MPSPSVPINEKVIRWNMAIRGWSNTTLSKVSGVGQSTLSRMFRLKVTRPDTLSRINKAFREVEPANEELVGYEILEGADKEGDDADESIGGSTPA